MFLFATMMKYHRPFRHLALLITPLVLLLAYNGCRWSGTTSESRAALPYGGAVGGHREELPVHREEAIYSPSIPDHPPFQQDFESPVVSRPWINDSACQSYEVRLGVDIPPVYLVSFPRSGNTWTRYLVEGATGIFTGSVFTCSFLYQSGFLGEIEKPSSKNVLLIKDHLYSGKALSDSPAILLIRDPKSAVASYLTFQEARSMHEVNFFLFKDSVSDPHTQRVHMKIQHSLSVWEKVATISLEYPTLMVMLYEDIKADPISSVRRILSFLKVPPDEGRLRCLQRNVEGKFNRGQPEHPPFTAEQIELFREATRRVSYLFEKRGLAPLPYNY